MKYVKDNVGWSDLNRDYKKAVQAVKKKKRKLSEDRHDDLQFVTTRRINDNDHIEYAHGVVFCFLI